MECFQNCVISMHLLCATAYIMSVLKHSKTFDVVLNLNIHSYREDDYSMDLLLKGQTYNHM